VTDFSAIGLGAFVEEWAVGSPKVSWAKLQLEPAGIWLRPGNQTWRLEIPKSHSHEGFDMGMG